jgi:uncharacterized protein (DUF362 family)/NAD-dependent dihydropyrimidine dehydrogenase PreA subunit
MQSGRNNFIIMPKVALIKCESYDNNEVFKSVLRGIDLLGGIEKFVIPNEKILIKPNLLTGVSPDRCVTTHPAVFKAVAEIFKEARAKVSYGDNPGVISPFSAARKAGISKIANELKIDLGDFSNSKVTHFKNGMQNKVFTIVNAVFENDGLISLPKFKTHELTKITGAVKNQFGCVPFLQKRLLHGKFKNPHDFAKMLLDLNQCIRPRLYIMDAIFAMEGDGPLSGDPKYLGLIALSSDPIALDATLCKIISLEPLLVPTILYGHQFGYGQYEDDKIEIIGDGIEKFISRDFKVERNKIEEHSELNLSGKIIHSLIKKPAIIKKNCIACGDCILACPVNPKAITLKKQDQGTFPEIDYKICIRCYCCHELCSENAIKLKAPGIMKIFQS